jgi:hypothetical protein
MVTLWATLERAAPSFGAEVYQTAAAIRAPLSKKYNHFNELLNSVE